MTSDVDTELKRIQLEAAKLDLEIKRSELRNRPVAILSGLSNPMVMAAVIAAVVTVSTSIISYVVSRHQIQLEQNKADNQLKLERFKTESAMILDVLRTGDPDQAATNLGFLVDAGLVTQAAPGVIHYLVNRHPGHGRFEALPGANQAPISPPR
jgi:hypothetical protein